MMTTLTAANDVELVVENVEKESNCEFLEFLVWQYSFLFPKFLRRLNITVYDTHPDGDEDTDSWCSGDWEYGNACINIMSKFFDRTLRRQHEIIVHELVHIAQMRFLSLVQKRLITWVKASNPDLATYLNDDKTERVEEFTVHMTGIIVDAHFEPKSVVEFRVKTEQPIDEAEEDSLGKGDLGLYPHGCSIAQATEG